MKRSEAKSPVLTSPAAPEQDAPVLDLDVGDEVSFTVGREGFTPIKFHTFDVGPVTVTGRVRAGETGADAAARVGSAARAVFDAEHARKLLDYLEHVRGVSEVVERRKG